MKKLSVSSLILITFIIFSSSLKANPIRTTFFNELLFDSTGWKLEMCLNSAGDSLSLKGWYLVSGRDTAYFKDWMYLRYRGYEDSKKYLVLTKDSLSGKLDLNMMADTLFLYSSDGHQWDWLIYGPDHLIPSPKLNQSICITPNSFYLDNSPTIGAKNDTSGATCAIHAYVKDAAGNPASKVWFSLYWEDKLFLTDSTGHFKFDNILASRYTFYFSKGDQNKFFNVWMEPGEMKELTFQLDWLTDVPKKPAIVVKENSLAQNYPNPFNPLTSISYSISNAGHVTLKVYNLLGNEIATLVNEFKNTGTHKASFDASSLPSGVYIYTIQAGEFRSAKKMTVMK